MKKINLCLIIICLATTLYSQGTWTTKTDMPTTRSAEGTAVVNGKIYVIGGMIIQQNVSTNIVEEYDPAIDTWTTKTPMPTTRQSFGVAVVNNKIYCIGGSLLNTNKITANEEYDPATDTWTTKAPMPTPRNALLCEAANGKIYAMGGMEGWTNPSAVVEEYNPATDTWTTKQPMLTANASFAAITYDDLIHVIGGVSPPNFFNLHEVYDPLTNSWDTLAQIPTARTGMGAEVLNSKIYVIGGITESGGYPGTDTNEVYNPLTNSWTTETSMPTARVSFGLKNVNNKLYAIGGQVGPMVATSINEEFTPVQSQNGLIAHYPFNGNANDESGNSNNGTVNGATLTTDRFGDTNGAYSFDGNAEIRAPSSTSLENFTDNISISTWVFIENYYQARFPVIDKYIEAPPTAGRSQCLLIASDNPDEGFGYQSICDGYVIYGKANQLPPMNEWHHIVSVYDGDSVYIYSNGIKSYANSTSGDICVNTGDLIIGHDEFGNDEWAIGKIDDILIYNRVLTGSEIDSLYHVGGWDSDIVAHYPFNGNANDESGNGNDGTVNGATLTLDRFGNTNSAYYFNGNGNYINVLNSSTLNFGADTNFTINVWINPDSYSPLQGLVEKAGDDGSGEGGWQFMLSNDKLYSEFGYGTTGGGFLGNENLNLSTWYMVTYVVNRNSTTAYHYINGSVDQFHVSPAFMDNISNTVSLRIGAERTLNSGYCFEGEIDDISIYNRALSQQEIDSLYHVGGWGSDSDIVAHYPFNGNANDESGNGHDGTVNGATLTNDRFGNTNSAYSFDGTNDYIETANSTGMNYPTGYSISTWVNFTQTHTGNIITKHNPGVNGGFAVSIANQKLRFYSSGADLIGTTNCNDGLWHHAVCVYDGGNSYLYVDNILEATYVGGSYVTNNASVLIGTVNNINFYNGLSDDIIVYGRVITESEIDSLYHIGGWDDIVCDFSGSPLTGSSPLNVAFTDISIGNPTIWKWDFENNGVFDSYIQFPTHTYTEPGTYSVKLVIENAGGSDTLVKNNYIAVSPQSIGTDLIAFYPFNGNADDESGNGHHGAVLGATLTNDRFGNNNSAYSFDGVNDYIYSSIGDSDTLAVSFWYKSASPDKYYPTFFSYYSTGFLGQYGGTLSPPYTSGDVICMPVNSGLQLLPIPEYNQWHHVYMDIDNVGNTQIVYVDGLYDNTYTGVSTISTGNDFHIGVDDPGGTPLQYFTGNLDDFRIYGRRLNEQEIIDLYNVSNIVVPEICIVTVDEVSGHNYVVWEKQITTEIDSFKVYRESTQANVFEQIGVVPYSDLGIYLDESSIPVQRPYKYKLSAIDGNGNETLLSNYHKTIHLTYSTGPQGMNLDWDPYEGFEFATYYIYKSTNPNNLEIIDSISSSFTSYTDVYPPWGNVYYAIEIVNDNGCSPSRNVYNKSRSNIVLTPVGIDENKNNDIRVFPIPTSNILIVEVGESWNVEHMTVKVMNMQGQVEISKLWNSSSKKLRLTNLKSGMYLLWVSDGNNQIIKKIIKN